MASIQQESCSAAAGAAPAFTNSSTSRHGPSSWPSVPNNTPLHPHQDKAKTSATNYKQASSRNKLATESLSSFPMPVNTATSHRQNHARRRRPPPQRISVHPRDRSTAPAVKPFKSASLPPESTSATSFGKDLAVAVQQPVQAVHSSGSTLHDGGHHQYYNKDGQQQQQQQQPLSAAIRQSYATENQYSFKQEGKSRHQHHRQHHSLPRQLFKTQQSREADKPKKSATWSAMPTNAISSATSTPTVTTATTIAVESLSCLTDASEGKERSSSPPSSESDFVDSLFAMAGLVDTPSDPSSSISCSPKKSGTTQATPSTSCSGSTTGPTVPVDDFYWAGDGLFSLPTPAQPSSATSSNSPGDAQMQHSKAFGRWFTAISEETGESGEAQTTDLPSSAMSNSDHDGDNLWQSTERSKESETIDSASSQTKSPPDQSDTLPFPSPTKQQVASISTSATTITSTPSVSKVVTPPPGFNARTIATQEHTAPRPDESLSTNTKQPVPIASPSWEEVPLSSTIPTTNNPSTINPTATPNNTADVAATTTAVTNGTAGLLDQLQPDHPAQSVEDDNRVSKVTVAPVKNPKNASNRKRRSLKSYLPASKPLTNPLISTNPVAPSSRPPGPPSQFLTNSSSITSASSSSAPASSIAVSSTGSGRNKRGGANTNTSNGNQNGTRGGGSSGSIPYPPPHPLTHPHLLLFNQAAVHAHSATFALHAAASLPSVYMHHQQQSQHGSRPPHPAAAYLSQNPYFSQNLYAAVSGSGYLTHPHHHHPHHVPHPHSHPHHLHPFNGYNNAYSLAGAAATASPYSHSNAAASTDNTTSTVGASTKQVPTSNGGRGFPAPKKGSSSSSSYGHHHHPSHAHHQQQHSQHKQAH
ncbi:Thyroid hormone receptor-associated protein complex subunit [Balamuthia mandrillaris]